MRKEFGRSSLVGRAGGPYPLPPSSVRCVRSSLHLCQSAPCPLRVPAGSCVWRVASLFPRRLCFHGCFCFLRFSVLVRPLFLPLRRFGFHAVWRLWFFWCRSVRRRCGRARLVGRFWRSGCCHLLPWPRRPCAWRFRPVLRAVLACCFRALSGRLSLLRLFCRVWSLGGLPLLRVCFVVPGLRPLFCAS